MEVSEHEITLRIGNRWLRFTPQQMQDSQGSTTGFHLNENGTVSREDRADEEMDLAAEEITREMFTSLA